MSFADYQRLVLEDYERKKAAGGLSRRMIRLTAAKFKAECEAVCSQRYDRKDERTLEEFFEPVGGDRVAWLKAISESDPNKFKPLVNFVKGKTRWPDKKVVELLAWLIDFKPRPHELGRRYDTMSMDISDYRHDEQVKEADEKTEESSQVEEFLPSGKKEKSAPGNSVKAARGFGKNKIAVTAIVIMIAIAGIYWAWPKSLAVVLTGPKECMYWAGDHYQQVSCSQQLGDTQIIPLDSEKLVRFRKITRPDTITENALGTIWYANYHGAYECYTGPGYHPIDTNLKLRLLNDFVLINHIRRKPETEMTSP